MPGPSPDAPDADLPAPGEAGRGSPYARDAIGTISFLMQLRRLGLAGNVLNAFEKVSRETFSPRRYVDLARRDISLPLPCGQVMTAPFTAARMIATLDVLPGQRVLEVGTGSGFLSAVLAGLAREVVSVERYRTLAIEAAGKLNGEGFDSVRVVHGDGLARLGLGEFDRILLNGQVTELPISVPEGLAETGKVVAIFGDAEGAFIVSWARERGGPLAPTIGAEATLPPLIAGVAEIL